MSIQMANLEILPHAITETKDRPAWPRCRRETGEHPDSFLRGMGNPG